MDNRWKLSLQYVSPAALKEWDKNPRKGLEEASARLAKSIEQMGFINPIIATPDGTVRAGHTRLKAARKLGLTEVPVIFVPFPTEEEAALYAIADNKSSEWTGWNREMLAEVLNSLKQIDAEELSAATTFKKSDVLNFQALHESAMTQEERHNALDAAYKATEGLDISLGDIFELGEHRLMCGDAGYPEHVALLMNGRTGDMVYTDPPYGVEARPRTSARIKQFMAQKIISGEEQLRPRDRQLVGDTDEAVVKNLDKWFASISTCLRPGGAVYVWGGYSNIGRFPDAMRRHGLYPCQTIVWVKNTSIPRSFTHGFRGAHEELYYGWKEGATPYFDELLSNTVRDVWEADTVFRTKMLHLTEKPVELAQKAMECSTTHGNLVVDLFGGSGSTLIAGDILGRRVYMMEIDPGYCRVIIDRWQRSRRDNLLASKL